MIFVASWISVGSFFVSWLASLRSVALSRGWRCHICAVIVPGENIALCVASVAFLPVVWFAVL